MSMPSQCLSTATSNIASRPPRRLSSILRRYRKTISRLSSSQHKPAFESQRLTAIQTGVSNTPTTTFEPLENRLLMSAVDQMEVNNISSPDVAFLNIKMTNNDTQAVYDSASLNVGLGQLADLIGTLNPALTPEDVLNGTEVRVQGAPTGDVYTGWHAELNINTGIIDLTHSGRNADKWTTSPESAMMAITISIPKNYLDFNQNGQIDPVFEQLVLTNHVITNGFVAETHDGFYENGNTQTYDLLVNTLIPGDTNQDNTVNLTDLVTLGENYNNPGQWPQGDFNNDNLVNLADLVTLGENYNTSLNTPATPATPQPITTNDTPESTITLTTPEPTTTLTLTLITLTTLLPSRRQKKYNP